MSFPIYVPFVSEVRQYTPQRYLWLVAIAANAQCMANAIVPAAYVVVYQGQVHVLNFHINQT